VYVPVDRSIPSQSDILDQARRVRAEVAIYFSVPQGREILNMPAATEVSPGSFSHTTINAQNGDLGMPQTIGTVETYTPPRMSEEFFTLCGIFANQS
jgi:hypothetical protein